MSGKNTSSKSGSKSCSSPEYYEDELVTWLQYPLEDSLEKGYCSDLFGQWPPAASGSATTSRLPPDVGASKASAGPGLCTEIGALSSAQASTEGEMSKEKMGNGPLLRTTCAEGALALGAERAAGLASQWGRDAFSKVRTSMQRPAGSHLTPPSAKAAGSSDQLMQSNWPAVAMGSLMSKAPSPTTAGGPQLLSGPPQSFAGFTAFMSDGQASTGKGAVPQPMSFTAYKPKYVLPDAPLQIPSAQESGCSRITEGASAHQRASDYASSASSRANLCSGQGSGTMPSRFSPAPMDLHGERKTAAVGVSEMALASSFGPSLSGTTVSTREASSHSGKRKCEESESQSVHMQDVDIESSMDVKQPRKTSKRNRAAEVHNLSERNRRNRINEKLKALQDLIPNSSKTDKASVLDEAIEYMKTLQMQLQMVSMRSGMNVSPMMIPVGMPHLQMAPLHPVGLGVPIGHPGMGMGMGMHVSMGMGMMEMPQGMMARPPQSMSGATNQYNVPYQGRTTTGSQDSSLDSTNIGSTASQFMPAAHITPQMCLASHSLPSTQMRQQQEQWQHSGEHAYNIEAMEQCNDKKGSREE